MNSRVAPEGLADAVMQQLEEYRKLTNLGVKKAVRAAGRKVRNGIQSGAPARTGTYAGSWTVKKTAENADSLEVTVCSPKRYMLAHLLEHGHALRGGGRALAIPHIASAEKEGEKTLEKDIERCLKRG